MEINSEYIDVESALKRVGGNKELYVKLLNQFLDAEHVNELDTALEAKDFEKAARDAHSIKGVCANLSLPELAESARELEQKIKNNEDYSEYLSDLKEIYDITKQQIAVVSQQLLS